MEQRVQQFHDDTKSIPTPPTAKTLKQMNTLKKFLFKNQACRFSDKEKNKLFACIEAYFTCFDRSATSNKNISAFPLIEDALKVPCFTTKQKMQLLKWYEEILSKQEDQPLEKPKPVENQEDNFDDFDWDAFEKEQD
ncbi:hypothetical protein PHYBLDRAFT_145695 [Phycomyces blakesleeanus NRRL 1555(-)]|uniref:Uncharacterized protein n=1 Tax=Phycomyces blakesleeanus (strain ATCC 8743b / DSM 1359 / FGSC 10004 / NBRC 33097 / NRRL 1555) TaxID=763407 RepID=A0A167MMM1_PHYB8|nr:hypothetical protein PHYBLDRAFT_145695 [Phycomyces blakesleeanus NRRL 1555(-)]OAD73296.1 hypothetical protein PHYBLDRAFT_145695 [Phycomyces blakesleeanus NRRL 1555(-)]|eukprot:XP_018291336.1 hypothetical protein PHYBLDRAFT_145695 [Phycomyces blakesleeanus NRRL 1555(-)]